MQDRQSLTAAEWDERIIEQSGAVGPVGCRDPEKSLEKLAYGALRQISGDENQPGAMIVVRPALEPSPVCDRQGRKIASWLRGAGWVPTDVAEAPGFDPESYIIEARQRDADEIAAQNSSGG